MIMTQTFAELGCPAGWEPKGLHFDIEEPTSEGGYGYTPEHGMRLAIAAFEERLLCGPGPLAVVLNAKITSCAGSGHPSYNRLYFRLVGDLYLKPRMVETLAKASRQLDLEEANSQ